MIPERGVKQSSPEQPHELHCERCRRIFFIAVEPLSKHVWRDRVERQKVICPHCGNTVRGPMWMGPQTKSRKRTIAKQHKQRRMTLKPK